MGALVQQGRFCRENGEQDPSEDRLRLDSTQSESSLIVGSSI